ncbi:hypothetical protein [Histidinibacterium aquaticum]|uniref:DUF4148 domain-containing protein n=1 Tax=Histidinibacterium aquaticum TaxID=2613962 RepID=A0A5J5GAK8_9RHOB|nr:hypothetical protein [Histidinibacterium aquaticum]KAA9005068.1 hypothetical protein F3S47_18745 [Histidinibacterium aquaticum]
MKVFASFVSVFAVVGSLAQADGRTHVQQITSARGTAYIVQANQIPFSVRQAAPRPQAPVQAAAVRTQQQQQLTPTPEILELERIQTGEGAGLPRVSLSVR